MTTDVVKMVEAVIAEKTRLAAREKDLVDSLNKILPTMGYRVVAMGGAPRGRRAGGRPTSDAAKTLSCQHCDRRFAHPLHLGRHMAAMHRTARRGRPRRKKKAVRRAR